MEKRRRERINKYLYELHSLLTDTDQSAASKLEKADILEMAVSRIRSLKQRLRTKVLGAYRMSKSTDVCILTITQVSHHSIS